MVSWFCLGSRMEGQTMMQEQKLKEKADEKSKRAKPSSAKPARDLPDSETVQHSDNRSQIFTYRELAIATNNFSMESMIGRGGFGTVYKGKIASGQMLDKFKTVAVKMLDNSGVQGDKEFLVEVLMHSVLHHENLVKLLGYCVEDGQRLIVYEYMPLGSLEDHIHDSREPLDWITRMEIAAGAAKGLEYLHTGKENYVIYRDLKTANILLDHDYKPKLSDFGLAKFFLAGDMVPVSTRVMGTHGYCAPEFANTGKSTFKSDIYSFGVILLELITGRKALMDSCLCNWPSRYLVHWAYSLYRKKQIHKIVDPRLSISPHMEVSLMRVIVVAFWCVSDDANARPSISELVKALDFIVESILKKKKKRNFDGVEQGIDLEMTMGTVSSLKERTRMLTIQEEKEEEGENGRLKGERAFAEAMALREICRIMRNVKSEQPKQTPSMC